MAGSARVQSIQDLAELRAFLVTLAEKIRDGLITANSEANSTAQWINHTQPARWKAECTKSQRLLEEANEALRKKRMSPTTDGRPPNCVLEMKMQRKAKERCEYAQAKARAVEQWQRRYEKQMFEYRRCSQSAQALVDVVIPKAMQFLDKLQEHLEKYTRIAFSHEVAEPTVSTDDDGGEALTLPVPDEFLELLKVDLESEPDDKEAQR